MRPIETTPGAPHAPAAQPARPLQSLRDSSGLIRPVGMGASAKQYAASAQAALAAVASDAVGSPSTPPPHARPAGGTSHMEFAMPEREAITVIGPDTHIKGEMVFDSNACILGRFEGRIVSKGNLQIGESALCKASLDAQRIVVDGHVEGDIVAREKLELNAGATVNGDIYAAKLVVAEGATFIGNCRVGESAFKTEPPAAKAEPAQPVAKPAGRQPVRAAQPAAREAAHSNGNGNGSGNGDIEATLAGFEAKLAEFSRAKAAAAE